MSLLPASSIGDESTGFYNGVATQSLRMNFGDSSYLYYTPSTGDRFTGTYSTWYKGSKITDSSYGAYYFNAYGGGSEANFTFAHIANDFQLAFDAYGTNYFHSNALYRDETNWYNIVWVWDTPNGTQTKRQRGFVNGEEVTSMSIDSRSGIRQMLAFGGNHQHTIFANYYNGSYDSYASGHHSYNVYVNGHALDPTAFGESKNGVWIPKEYATKPSLIAQDTGTAIGDLTAQGGLAGAFNGTRFQATSSGAATSGNVSTGYIGKNWGSSKTVTGFILYSPTSDGFVGSGGSTFTVKLYGKNSAPSNATDGTLLYTSSSVNDNLVSTNGERGSIRYFADTTIVSEETVSNFTTGTAYSYHWVVITPNSSTTVNVGEIEFYEDGNNYFGTGGFKLDFNASDLNTSGSSRTDPHGSDTDQPNNSIADASGSGNHISYNGVAASDFSLDNPENNFAIFNALTPINDGSLSEANLKFTGSSGWGGSQSTFVIPSSGKWYAELRIGSNTSNSAQLHFGIQKSGVTNGYSVTGFYGFEINNGFFTYVNGTASGYTSAKSAGDILQMAIDADNGKIYYGHNNTYYVNYNTTGGDPSGGNNPSASSLDFGATDFIIIFRSNNNNGVINFGQDGTFAGTETAQDNADANGIGNFYYAPPTDFLALCSSNLPDPTIGPQTSTQADDHFDTITYTGSASNQTITTNFQADWLWFKERTTNGIDHNLFDSSRLHSSSSAKFGKKLESNTNDAEADSTAIVSQSTNDITLTGGVSTVNDQYSRTYVMWHWKANGGTLTTNDASATGVGTIDSQYQANTTAGFSIVTYTGTGSAGTIAHGLGKKPALMISKGLSSGYSWFVYNHKSGATKALILNSNGAEDSYSTTYNNTEPTTSVFSVGTATATNGNGINYIHYIFAEIEGYSKFGEFTGNNLLNGPFIYTGFRPAWILAKRSDSTSDWFLLDNKRSPENVVGGGGVGQLAANQSYPESSLSTYAIVDFLSNGFKMRSDMNYGYWNASGGTYIYLAFAEQPFKFSNAR